MPSNDGYRRARTWFREQKVSNSKRTTGRGLFYIKRTVLCVYTFEAGFHTTLGNLTRLSAAAAANKNAFTRANDVLLAPLPIPQKGQETFYKLVRAVKSNLGEGLQDVIDSGSSYLASINNNTDATDKAVDAGRNMFVKVGQKDVDGPAHWIVEMPRRSTMKVISALSVDILPVCLSSPASSF